MRFTFVALLILAALGCEEPPAPLAVAAPIIVREPDVNLPREFWVPHYASKFGVDPDLALRVSQRENWSGDRWAWSPSRCCVGVMQVHLRHLGTYDRECGGSDLGTVKTNSCYGVLLLRRDILECDQDLDCALRKYVGQVDSVHIGDRYVSDILGIAPLR